MRIKSVFTSACVFIGLILVGMSAPVFAWGPAGHKIVAAVAFRQLTDAEQVKVIEILENHPRFSEDFTEDMPEDVSAGDEATKREWLFQQAAIWPDMARGFRGEDQRRFHRPSWHYINRPYYLTDADRMALENTINVNLELDPPVGDLTGMNVIQAIRHARAVLTDDNAESEEKAILLAWLFHTVGDIHQPMHSTALFSRRLFRSGDRGGNGVKTVQRGNLHSLWDGLPGGNIRFTTVQRRALALVNDSDATLTAARMRAATTLGEDTWLGESFELAKSDAYGPEVINALKQLEQMQVDIDQHPISLSTQYMSDSGKIASRRVLEGGVRLGKILKEIVAE